VYAKVPVYSISYSWSATIRP